MSKFKRLQFTEYVKKLPTAAVFEHFVNDESSQRRIVSPDLINTISTEFMQKEALSLRFSQLNEQVKKICFLIYLHGDAGLHATPYKEHHQELMNSFLLYMASDHRGDTFYFGFPDLENSMGSLLAKYMGESSTVSIPSSPLIAEPCSTLSDMVIFAGLALQGLVKRKKDGQLSQITLVELKKKIHCTDSAHTTKLDGETIDTYGELLCAFAEKRRLIEQHGEGFDTLYNGWFELFKNPSQDLHTELIRFYLDSLGGWSFTLVIQLLSATHDQWLSSTIFEELDASGFNTFLQMLFCLGVVELQLEHGEILYRRKQPSYSVEHSQSDQRIMVLPDFSVILPQELAPTKLMQFLQVGEVNSFDKVYKGTINRVCIFNSLSRGTTADTLIDLLQQWNTPANIIESVKEWIREFSRLGIIRQQVVVSFDQQTSRELSSFTTISNLLEPVEVHRIFKIKEGCEKRVEDILKDMGFDARLATKEPSHFTDASITFKNQPENPMISLDFKHQVVAEPRSVKSGKYSEELKNLDQSEMYHVIEYATLMGYDLRIVYEGDDSIGPGEYTFKPYKCIQGPDSHITTQHAITGVITKYFIKKIAKIGVKTA